MDTKRIYDAALQLLAAGVRYCGLRYDETQLHYYVDKAWRMAELLEKREKRYIKENGPIR